MNVCMILRGNFISGEFAGGNKNRSLVLAD